MFLQRFKGRTTQGKEVSAIYKPAAGCCLGSALSTPSGAAMAQEYE